MSAALLALCVLGAASTERSILADLERIDQALNAAETQLHQSETARTHLQSELSGTESELAAAKMRQADAYKSFAKRVRVLAREPSGARLALLGGAGSLAEYLQATRLLRWVADHDRRLHAHYVAETLRLAALDEERRGRRQALDSAIAQARGARDKLAAERRERSDLLASVRSDKSKAEALAEERRRAQEKLRAMVARLEPPAGPPPPRPPKSQSAALSTPELAGRSLQKGGASPSAADRARLAPLTGARVAFAQNRGRLPWPATGAVRVAFGQRVELAFGTVTSHNGLDIGAPAGARVQAVAPGTVAYANWLRGYGQMVIIDHGEQYHTVSAHLASIDVSVGDTVAAGQEIGAVGDTGSLRGTVLYFEVRYKGTPVDPRQWLRR